MYSIPYAQPPVGNLRFQNPIAIGYHGDLDVSNNTGVGCIGLRVLCSIGQCAEYVSELSFYMHSCRPISFSDSLTFFQTEDDSKNIKKQIKQVTLLELTSHYYTQNQWCKK